jgi:hypothetical protein
MLALRVPSTIKPVALFVVLALSVSSNLVVLSLLVWIASRVPSPTSLERSIVLFALAVPLPTAWDRPTARLVPLVPLLMPTAPSNVRLVWQVSSKTPPVNRLVSHVKLVPMSPATLSALLVSLARSALVVPMCASSVPLVLTKMLTVKANANLVILASMKFVKARLNALCAPLASSALRLLPLLVLIANRERTLLSTERANARLVPSELSPTISVQLLAKLVTSVASPTPIVPPLARSVPSASLLLSPVSPLARTALPAATKI